MKKKLMLLSVVAIAAITTVSGLAGFNIQKQESKFNTLTLANVEALTSGETVTKNCPGGNNECARITTSPQKVHIYYEN